MGIGSDSDVRDSAGRTSILPKAVAQDNENSRFKRVFFNIAPAMFLGTLDQTIVAAALPAMAAALGNFIHIAWVVTAYLLAASIAAPVYGRLGDAFGRKPALVWALGLFVAGSLACTFAPDFEALVAGRFLQGLGGGGLMTLAQALIGEAVPPKDRGRFQGWFSAIFALASTVGPLAGGFLSDAVGWRSIFWINIPLGVLTAVTVMRITALPGDHKFRFDIWGTALIVGASSALLVALSLGLALGWTSPKVVGILCLSIFGFGLLVPVERRARDPLIPFDLLSASVVWRCSLCVFLFSAVLFALVVQLPLFLQLVVNKSATFSGLMLLPAILAQVAMSMVAGTHVSVTGRTGKVMAIGFGITTVGFFGMAAMLHLSLWAIGAASVLVGFGLGAIGPVSQTVVQWAGGGTNLGRATGLISLCRSIGGLVGTALASTLLIGTFQHLAPNMTGEVTEALDAAVQSVTLPVAALDVAELGFRLVFASLGIVTLFAAILAATIPDIDLGAKRGR